MVRPKRIRPILMLIGLTLISAAARPSPRVQWQLALGFCRGGGEEVLRADAGGYGVFHFSLDGAELPECETRLAGGEEEVAVYPHSGPAPFEVACRPGDACATAPGSLGTPWIAVVDWDGWHGRAVDQLARAVTHSSVRSALVTLESDVLPAPAITDVDVIVSLAGLVLLVDSGAEPPLVVNLSFGRAAAATDPTAGTCAPDRLACQIVRLLEHLALPKDSGRDPTVLVAAAGNHREKLFPGSLEQVVGVGTLDLARYGVDGTLATTWETPLEPDYPQAFMPGIGPCVQVVLDGFPHDQPAPPGSSFAAAFLSGWLADALIGQRDDVLAQLGSGDPWLPWSPCAGVASCAIFELAKGAERFPNTSGRAAQRLADLLAGAPPCGAPVATATIEGELVPISSTDDPFRFPSLPGLLWLIHHPAPEPKPCVPCDLCCQIVDPSPGVFGSKRRATHRGPIELEIDASAGWSVPDSMVLEGLYVRFGNLIFRVELSGPDLAAFASGMVETLRLRSVHADTNLSEQPTLIALMSLVDPQGQKRRFWDATPLLPRSP